MCVAPTCACVCVCACVRGRDGAWCVEGKKTHKDAFDEEMCQDMLGELIQVNILITDLLGKDISFQEPKKRPVNSSN